MPAPDRLYYEMAMIRRDRRGAPSRKKTEPQGWRPTIPLCLPRHARQTLLRCLARRHLTGLGSGVLTKPIRFMPAREASAMTCASTS